MIFTLLMSLFSLSLDLLAIIIVAKSDKDLEIIILRQQVRLLQTQNKDTPADIGSRKNGFGDPHGQVQPIHGWCTPAPSSGDVDLQTRHSASLASRTGPP
jgi:hypothetical protein